MRIWPLWTACARAWPSWRPKLPYRLWAATSPAKRIAAGSYGVQIPKLYDDEIGELAQTINDMSVKIGQAEKTLLRGEAQPGDVIFLIGRTGLARAGLLLLEERGRAALNEWPIPCEAHLRPAPRLKEGMRLSRLAADWGREKGDPSCGRLGLMDLSDGLARDLPRLVGHGRGHRHAHAAH